MHRAGQRCFEWKSLWFPRSRPRRTSNLSEIKLLILRSEFSAGLKNCCAFLRCAFILRYLCPLLYLSKDVIKWFQVNSAWHDFQISKSWCCCSFWLIVLKIITKNLQRLMIHDLREWGVKRPSACGSDVKGVDQLSYFDWIFLFILLEYIQKYLHLSTFKTTPFLLLLKYFFGQYFILYFKYFLSVTKLVLDYKSRITNYKSWVQVLFTPLLKTLCKV